MLKHVAEHICGTSQRELWRLPKVQEKTGLSRTGVYSRIASGTFPKPISIDGGSLAAWDSIAVQQWIDDQVRRFGERA